MQIKVTTSKAKRTLAIASDKQGDLLGRRVYLVEVFSTEEYDIIELRSGALCCLRLGPDHSVHQEIVEWLRHTNGSESSVREFGDHRTRNIGKSTLREK